MEHHLTFNGVSSADYGVWISGGGTYNAPARDVTTAVIPGRNGTISFDNGRYENITVTYPAFISKHFDKRIEAFRAFICSQQGYQRLEDTYHPDEYRLALYKSGLDVSTTPRNLAGSFDIVFDCKPQRFLKLGDVVVTPENGTIVYNPTRFDALPLIRVYGSGTFNLGGVRMTITDNTSFIDIDCDTQNAYRGIYNMNSHVTFDFPVLKPGESFLSWSGIDSIEITPRFWTI